MLSWPGLRPVIFGSALAGMLSAAALADIAPLPPEPTDAPVEATDEKPVDPAEARAAALAIKERDVGLGDPNAPVKWVEYASAGCPHCAHLSLEIMPALKAEYVDTGKVYYVLRDFPLDNPSAAASVIARCLPSDKFYPFMDSVFASQTRWHGPGVTDSGVVLKELAMAQGLDEAGFDACLGRQDLLEAIIAGVKEADEALKISSTPSSFINGELIVGAAPVADFKAALDKALGVEPSGGMTPKPEDAPGKSTPVPTP